MTVDDQGNGSRSLRLAGVSAALDGTPVLGSVNLAVASEEVVAVLGPSGAGKSTLLAVIAGLLPSTGQIRIEGDRVDEMNDRDRSRHRLRRLGVVFQTDQFIPELSLAENITLPLQLSGRRQTSESLLAAATELTTELGIADLLARRPQAVSVGELQRAAIARALVHEPALVLADEPTASLDELAAQIAMKLLIRLAKQRGTAVLLVTHDPVVASMCDRQVQLRAGVLDPVPILGANA